MKKKNVLWIVLDLIFLIIFNAFFFLLGGVEHNVSVWLSYGFIHFAYFMMILTPILIRKGKSVAIFGFSLYSISSVYFIVELLTGIIVILIAPVVYTAALLVQLVIAGVYAIVLISNMIANEATADAEEKRQFHIEYVKEASAKTKGLADRVTDRKIKKKIERVYDAIHSSPVKSHPNLAQMESGILQAICKLEDAISDEDNESINSLAASLLADINERNIRLKLLNR